MSDEVNTIGRDYLTKEEKTQWNFTSGVSIDGIKYQTASYSPEHLEVNFLNGTVNFYSTYNLYYEWQW
jgi:hypothetical protein